MRYWCDFEKEGRLYTHKKETPRPVLSIVIMIILLFCFLVPGLLYISYINQEQKKWDNEKLIKSVTYLDRGEISERRLILNLLKSGIPPENIFHDLFVQKRSGNFTQIDVAMVTDVGVIVFEVKDYSGWIFGSGRQKNWTQVLSYGRKKHYFYNPVLQNSSHIKHLQNALWQEKIPFYSIIVFYGYCRLRRINGLPKGTFIGYPDQVMNMINGIINNNPPAEYYNKNRVLKFLKTAMENGNNIDNFNSHISYVQSMRNRYD